MKHILLLPFLVLIGCANEQDETAFFQEAISASFDYLFTESDFLSSQRGVIDPLVFSTFAMEPDGDMIRQDANEPQRLGILEILGFDIEECINIWEKYKGKDLSVYVAESHLQFIIPEHDTRDRGTNVSFSAPISVNDTLFFAYMVFETKENSSSSTEC